VIVNSNLFLESRGDHPFPFHFNYELAALMATTLEAGFLRPGYDQVLALPSVWRRPHEFDDLELHRERRLLLSFKGKILSRNPVPYQAYRWLAAEYWHNESGVYVDAHCGDNGYELEGQEAYGELLLNSTFVFAPGGNGQSSYRFTEALNADAIPVVMSYVSLPFEPEVDWSRCVVRVAEARIPDVPNMLRAMSEEEIHSRRERCRTLYRGVIGREKEDIGWTSQPYSKAAIVTALQIWRQRILQAFNRRQGLAAIDSSLEELAIISSQN
jgi:Exostosin family